MRAQLYTAPTIEPISLAEAETHLRLDEIEYGLSDLIADGRAVVEAITRRALLTQTWDYYLQEWPEDNCIVLPFGNLQNAAGTPPSIPSTAPVVSWKNSSGTETTLAATTDYLVETNGTQCGRVVLPFSGSWPSGDLYPVNPIKIRFVCGWTTAALVPANIKRAVKLATEDAYYHGDRHDILRPVIDSLLASWRLWEEF